MLCKCSVFGQHNKMAFPEVYILRHGQTQWNAQGRLQGHFDSELTDLGREQAMAQRAILERCDLTGARLWSSPLGRAVHTAQIVLPGWNIETHEDLAEIGIGAWAGQFLTDLPPEACQNHSSDGFLDLYDHAPGGEGLIGLHQRCVRFLHALTGPSVIVTHGITSRMLRVILMGGGCSDLSGVDGGQGVVFKIKDQLQTKLTFGA
jgi:probable phosphoglycerate mutase